MLRIQVLPKSGENVYHILCSKMDNDAKTFYWADKKKLNLRHVSPSHPGKLRVRDGEGVLLAETAEHDQIVGAFIARLSAWFPEEIAAINIQLVNDNHSPKKKAKKK